MIGHGVGTRRKKGLTANLTINRIGEHEPSVKGSHVSRPEHVTVPGASRAVEGLDVDALRDAIRTEYASVAADPARGFHFHTGRRLARILGYDEDWLAGVPEDSIASFAGTGNPFSVGRLGAGERVVDIGCGAGIDSLIAARMVGPSGEVIGVDMTPAMLDRARTSAARGGFSNVRFEEGLAESLPVPDEWADVVISNGVLNLFPDKLAGCARCRACSGRAGRLQIGDILVQKSVGERGNVTSTCGRVESRALCWKQSFEATVVAAGFVGFEIAARVDVYADAPQASSAAKFGTLGISFRARKASNEDEWATALAALSCSTN